MYPFNLHTLLTESASRYPDREAVVFKRSSITYSELESMSNRLANALAERGVMAGDRVGIVLNKSIESIISAFGILKAGAIYVPIDPYSPQDRVNHIIRNCGIECVITSVQNGGTLVSVIDSDTPLKKAFIIGWKQGAVKNQKPRPEAIPWESVFEAHDTRPNLSVTDGTPAYILHTSGSTGIPKGVVISHLNALTFVNMAADYFHLDHEDRICSHAPLHFDLSIFDIFGAVKAGSTIFIAPEFLSTFPLMLAEFIEQEHISVWNSVSSVLAMLADRGRIERFDFDSLRLVHFSGDVMPVKYLRILKRHMKKASFYNIYGQTEANSSMFYPVAAIPGNDVWKIPIGKPFPNFDVFALDQAGRVITGPGEEGELYVNSSTVALGYWNDHVRTADRFVPDPRRSSYTGTVYKTGDLVRLDADGNYLFSGRKDHQIKSRGYRIELDEIETVINSHPSVKQGVVLALPDDLAGNRIIAIVTPVSGLTVNAADLIDYCTLRLPKYMVPELIRCCESLPATSTGKIDRKKLALSYAGLNIDNEAGMQTPV